MKTPFYEKHISFGGKIVNFFGFQLPIQYQSVIQEVKQVRTKVGVFGVSHMGRIEVQGEGRDEFVSKITTNDPLKLSLFQAQYSCICYEDGGIVDDLVLYKLPNKFLLVVNGANRKKNYEWMVKHKLKNIVLK